MIRDKLIQELQELSRDRTLNPAFVTAIQGTSDDDLAYLAQSIDDSDYSMREWLLALEEFARWQAQSGGSAFTPRFQIEYLNCCVQGSVQGGGKLLPLVEVFREYARLYGIKGAM